MATRSELFLLWKAPEAPSQGNPHLDPVDSAGLAPHVGWPPSAMSKAVTATASGSRPPDLMASPPRLPAGMPQVSVFCFWDRTT